MKDLFGRKNWIILILFGLVGQLAWSVENMYFNLFVFETIAPNLDAVTLMVQLSGIVATAVTLLAGTLSDKLGNRRSFISIGYIVWGFTVILFAFLKLAEHYIARRHDIVHVHRERYVSIGIQRSDSTIQQPLVACREFAGERFTVSDLAQVFGSFLQ